MSPKYETALQAMGASLAMPAPVQRDPVISALESCFEKLSDLEVWQHCMGMKRISSIPDFAREAADHIIVVCLDCEHWSNNTDETTEVGIATFSRPDVAPLMEKGDVGGFGERLLQQVQFYLLRMIETSHLPNQNPESRGVLGNRFGQGRFVTFAEARAIMHDLFVQPIKNVPGLKGNHPIVVLGHDVGHDKNNLKHKAIAFDMDPLDTVVRYIDTQVLVRDRKFWDTPNNEQIGLKRLVENLWFQHSDPHTAANDAGRTLICAFQLGLGEKERQKNATKTMLEMATGIEEYSVAHFKSIGGVKEYCWRCGQKGHMKSACTATDLHCDECKVSNCKLEPGEDHVTAHCMCIANKKAALRRERDALARARKKQRNKYAPRGRSSSYENPRPFSHDRSSRPSFSPSRASHAGLSNGNDVAQDSRRGSAFHGNWRGRSNHGSASTFSSRLSNGSIPGNNRSSNDSSRQGSVDEDWSRDDPEQDL